ncbi:MAG: hypothetical protein NUW01_03650 [Gemmatimonadaceae bacterium]|nr:hypothetical protein [Gemmatimonadaceae bacterium]
MLSTAIPTEITDPVNARILSCGRWCARTGIDPESMRSGAD